MRRFLVVAASLVAFPAGAAANPNDITLSRLSYPLLVDNTNNPILDSNHNGILDSEEPGTLGRECGQAPEPGGTAENRCAPHQWAFRNLAAQLGRAFAPKLMAPAETLGYNGFYVGIEGTIVRIDDNADYWAYGFEGSRDDYEAGIPPQGRDVDPVLFVPALHLRKGLPFGAEVGTALHYMWYSSLIGLGLDVRVAPFEGFFEGVGYLPALAVRGAVTRLTGDDELNLTVVGVDVSISKAFGAWGQIEITPYGGWQHLWIIADTEVVDFTPERDAWSELEPRWDPFARCLSSDGSREYNPDISGLDPEDDRDAIERACAAEGGHWEPDWVQSGGGNPDDYNNNGVFDREDMEHERAFVGLRVIWEHLAVTGEFAMDLTQWKTVDAPKQWNATLGIGLDW